VGSGVGKYIGRLTQVVEGRFIPEHLINWVGFWGGGVL
jgi:hypothetical protein